MGFLRRLKSLFSRRSSDEGKEGGPGRGERRKNESASEGEGGAKAAESESSKGAEPMVRVQRTSDSVQQKQLRDLVIGFDWGTSCTKVVVQDPYSADRAAYLVDFGALGHEENSYLRPSRLFVDAEGKAYLKGGDERFPLDGIKLRLMEASDEAYGPQAFPSLRANPQVWAALFIALVLRYVRRWMAEEYAAAYQQYRIIWQLNLGIPATCYDEEEVRQVFLKVTQAAWWLSMKSRRLITVEEAMRALNRAEQPSFEPGIHPEYINVVPEVAAQVVGFAKSDSRQEGLYVLVDVGAATLDVASFILKTRKGQDVYSILTSAVAPLGAYRLQQARMKYIEANGSSYFASEDDFEEWFASLKDDVGPLHRPLHRVRDYFPDGIEVGTRLPYDPDEHFIETCWRSVLQKTLDDLRQKRYPKAPEWKDGLPFFICGGGQYVRVYHVALRRLSGWWQDNTTVANFRVRTLPKPETLVADSLSHQVYSRFSVAYGLSFPIDDIGDVRPSSEIPDVKIDIITRQKSWHEDMKALT